MTGLGIPQMLGGNKDTVEAVKTCLGTKMGKQTMEWISVKDKLPQNKQQVLFWSENDATTLRGIFLDLYGESYKRVFVCFAVYSIRDGEVTHWMPLPEPPA